MPTEKPNDVLPEVPDSINTGSYLELLLKITDDFRCTKDDLECLRKHCGDDAWVRQIYKMLLQKDDRSSQRLCLLLGPILHRYTDSDYKRVSTKLSDCLKEVFDKRAEEMRMLCKTIVPFLNAADELIMLVLHEDQWTEYVIPEMERLYERVDVLRQRFAAIRSQTISDDADFETIARGLQEITQTARAMLEHQQTRKAEATESKIQLLSILYGQAKAKEVAPRYSPAMLVDEHNLFARAAKLRMSSYLETVPRSLAIPMQKVQEQGGKRTGNATVQYILDQHSCWKKEQRDLKTNFTKQLNFYESIVSVIERAFNATPNQENSPP